MKVWLITFIEKIIVGVSAEKLGDVCLQKLQCRSVKKDWVLRSFKLIFDEYGNNDLVNNGCLKNKKFYFEASSISDTFLVQSDDVMKTTTIKHQNLLNRYLLLLINKIK